MSPGDVVVTEKIQGVDVNDKVKLDRVLMLGSRDETIIGRPLVPQATVSAVVEVCLSYHNCSRYEGLLLIGGTFHWIFCVMSLLDVHVQEQFQDAKVLIFKKRRRKNSRNLKGHRQVGQDWACLA